jgi:hypothetical protein
MYVARVRVTLQLTASQSVNLGVDAILELMSRRLCYMMTITVFVFLGRPLWREGVCHLSEVSVFIIFPYLYRNIYNSIYTGKYEQYVQRLCQSRLCEADYALSYLTYAMTTASHLNGHRPDRRQV